MIKFSDMVVDSNKPSDMSMGVGGDNCAGRPIFDFSHINKYTGCLGMSHYSIKMRKLSDDDLSKNLATWRGRYALDIVPFYYRSRMFGGKIAENSYRDKPFYGNAFGYWEDGDD